MASNAERQRLYRQRHLKDPDGQLERVNIMVSLPARAALGRLAGFWGTTQRRALERALTDSESRVLDGLAGEEQGRYYDKLLRRNEVAGTPQSETEPLQGNGQAAVQVEVPLLRNKPEPTSDRDKAILELFAAGKPKRGIGRELGISDGTVRNVLTRFAVTAK